MILFNLIIALLEIYFLFHMIRVVVASLKQIMEEDKEVF